jgi:hypothetical protein
MALNTTVNFLKKIHRNDSLLNILLQCEDFLDQLDLYSFANWLKYGEVCDGPKVARHWVTFTLKYPYKKMPDPQGGMRLIYHGCKVTYQKSTEEVEVEIKSKDSFDVEGNPKTKTEKIWLVEITIPKRFIDDLNDLEEFEDELNDAGTDVETVEDATDDGISDTSDVQQNGDANTTPDVSGAGSSEDNKNEMEF